ncbi:hypothetical protein FALBO_12768 [Fusarium albosuccineum]|uniref:Uncharacterized protein n=2 Tax=Fusarium decemcellulare species complex TaxID=1329916 RepID=A0A8H4L2E4_9HYPO|nr:hypothetical protein FALBO_12768 [Fusarium albosuccineum]KAF4979865.1 hypothetical protein FDECE_17991 [Fusarium decemcellulare]KAJ3510839.1 hypothetical protein NM208_g15487 [Fusarium decemcellulare]
MASASSNPFPLASEKPYGDDDAPGLTGEDAGASGDSSGNSVSISQGGMIAIIVVVVVVSIIGISTAILFFVAKKREWKVKETLRKSARKVVTALTPRRTEFPSSVKDSHPTSMRNRTRIDDDVPPTPRIRPEDLEKGLAQAQAKRMQKKWGRK